jgi:hypothetical protein
MTNEIPAPILLALQSAIKQYDTTGDTNQLIEDIAIICVVTQPLEKVGSKNSLTIPACPMCHDLGAKVSSCPEVLQGKSECKHCGQDVMTEDMKQAMQRTLDGLEVKE